MSTLAVRTGSFWHDHIQTLYLNFCQSENVLNTNKKQTQTKNKQTKTTTPPPKKQQQTNKAFIKRQHIHGTNTHLYNKSYRTLFTSS